MFFTSSRRDEFQEQVRSGADDRERKTSDPAKGANNGAGLAVSVIDPVGGMMDDGYASFSIIVRTPSLPDEIIGAGILPDGS